MATRSPLRAIPAPLALVVCGALVNILVGQVVRNVLRWLIYLDSLGTIVAGALGGPIAGAATGALSNVVWGVVFNDPRIIPFAITAACIGAAGAALAAELDAFRHPLTAAFARIPDPASSPRSCPRRSPLTCCKATWVVGPVR